MKHLYSSLLLSLLSGWLFVANAQIDFANLQEEQVYRKGNKYNTWSVSAGFGPVIYYVDVIDYTVFPSSNWKFGPSFMVSKQFNRPWGMDAQFMMADMYGEKNKRYFSGDLLDFSMNLTFSINQLAIFGPINDKWNIYGKLGFGLVYFRSSQQALVDRSIGGEFVAQDQYLQVKHVFPYISGYPDVLEWDADDYLVLGYDRTEEQPGAKTKRHNEIVIPFGIGAHYRINKHFDLGAEVMMRNMNADNLDVNPTGADNDSYMYTSFNLRYKIGKKDKRHAAWTYKDFNMDYRRKRQLDPMALKLDSIRQEIEYMASRDTAIHDTTRIFTESIVYQEGVSESVYFDFDKSDITKQSHRSIAKLARVMKYNEHIRIRIVGYCDARGSEEYNLRLSMRRCNAVRDVLINEYKIDPARLQTDPKGESELLSDTEKQKPYGLHLVNRRVDMFVIVE